MGYRQWADNVNLRVARSPVGRYFRLEYSGSVGLAIPIDIEEIC